MMDRKYCSHTKRQFVFVLKQCIVVKCKPEFVLQLKNIHGLQLDILINGSGTIGMYKWLFHNPKSTTL